MSETSVSEKTKRLLWGRAAGRCQYHGCNEPLWRDQLTRFEFNSAYVAHIVADSPAGPRGDPKRSEELKHCITNLMLLCDRHHRLIDREDVAGHSEERLQAMKQVHERRVQVVTGIPEQNRTHLLVYGANIGDHRSALSYASVAKAVIPLRYPASEQPLRLDVRDSAAKDRNADFWQREEGSLLEKFRERVVPGRADGTIAHVSVFALAPQPLLVRLGTLLTDIGPYETFQLHREPKGWVWAEDRRQSFRVTRPDAVTGPPVLILSISATITQERIGGVLGEGFTPWMITVDAPNQDCVRCRDQLREFRQTARSLFDEIKRLHGQGTRLHIFPAAPVSVAVELGCVRQPKADLPWRIYDQNNQLGGFVAALDIE